MDEVLELNDELENVTEEISQICAEKNKDLVNEYLGRNNDVIEGYSQAKTWSLKKKLCPKNSTEAPSAKKDDEGNLVTDREALSKLYSETYINRLKPNPVAEGYEELKTLKEYLFQLQMKLAKSRASMDWLMEDLENALKSFDNGKARDEHNHVFELFKYGGQHLKVSLLKLFNLVKKTQTYP